MSMQTDGSKPAVPYRQYAVVALAAVVGAAASLGVFFMAYSWERDAVRQEFDSLADARFRAVENMIDGTAKLLSFTDDVFQVGPHVDSAEFPHYISSLKSLLERDLAGHLELNGVTWIPRVSPDERVAYERAAQAVIDPTFQLQKSDTPSDCFPCYLCLGKTALHSRLGEDMALDPTMWEVMQQARDTDAILAGAPMKLSDDAKHLGYRLFVPIYAGEVQDNAAARRKALSGFLCVDLAVGELIDLAFKKVAPTGIDVRLIDETDKSPVDVCRHVSRLETAAACQSAGCSSNQFEETTPTDFFGRKILLRCVSTDTFWARRTIWEPWVLLFGGLAVTVVGAGYQLASASRANTIERVVNTRLAAIQREAELRR
jgi:CHASE1-domain containing sensor protein